MHNLVGMVRNMHPICKISFSPKLWTALAEAWSHSSADYLICYHTLRDIIGKHKFDDTLTTKVPDTRMHGSGESHTGYIYKRNACPTHRASPRVLVPQFQNARKRTQDGLQCLADYVDKMVHEIDGNIGVTTRSKSL